MKTPIKFHKGKLYYTTCGRHNNLMYLNSFYSHQWQTMIHEFENLDNKVVRLYEKDFGVKYSVYLDL